MNSEEWGLTERGFNRPDFNSLLDAVEEKCRELFGQKVNLTVRSPLGIFMRIYAWMLDILFQITEDVYNSRFIDTAVGTSLYNLGRAIGLSILPAQKSTGILTVTGNPGTIVRAGFLASTGENLQFSVTQSAVIPGSGSVKVPIIAFETGYIYNVAEGKINTIVNPVSGIESVTNETPTSSGRERETDEEFRDRYLVSIDFLGGVNADAIASEIKQNCPGVLQVKVFENDTDVTDENGISPHCIAAVVHGGEISDIAKSIYRRKAAGISTIGNVATVVQSASGQNMPISFYRPNPVSVWIKITNLVTDDKFPEDGNEQIAQKIVEFIDGYGGYNGLGIGEDVVYMSIPDKIFAVDGVIDFSLSISKNGSTFNTQNISIGMLEKAVTDESRVFFGV